MQKDGDAVNPLALEFPLYALEDYDSYYPHHVWKVGIKTTLPDILRRRLIGSVIATHLGNSSVDNAVRKYVPAVDEKPILRLGARAVSFIESSHSWMHDLVERLTRHDDQNIGRVMAELTMLRQEYTAKCFLYIANRGAIFEGYSLLRMQFEQFAWIVAVDKVGDTARVQRTKAQSSLRNLNQVVPGASRLYGLLSAHAHWNYDAHTRAITTDEHGASGVLFASVEHKAELLSHAVQFCGVFARIIEKLRRGEINQVQDAPEVRKRLEDIRSTATALSAEIWDMIDAHGKRTN